MKRCKGSFLDYFLPMLGILQYYSTGATGSYGSLILYAYGAVQLLLMLGRKRIFFHKGLLLFTIYSLISQPLVFLTYGGFNSARLFNLVSIVYIFLLASIFSDKLNISVFFRNYLVVGVIASAFIIVQAVQLYLFHQKVHGIALLPCDMSAWYDGGQRPCGLFPEPSVYAYYMIPLLLMTLRRGKTGFALFITASIFISTSSMGIACVVFVWLWHLIVDLKDVKKAAILLVVFVLVGLLVLNADVSGIALEKLFGNDYANSPRLTRGWFIFQNLDGVEQLFGIGMNNLQYYIDHGFVQLTDYASTIVSFENRAYVTSVYQVLIGFGFIGFLIYFIPFVRQVFAGDSERPYFILLVGLSVAQTMFFSMNFLMLIIPLFNFIDKEHSVSFIAVNPVLSSSKEGK